MLVRTWSGLSQNSAFNGGGHAIGGTGAKLGQQQRIVRGRDFGRKPQDEQRIAVEGRMDGADGTRKALSLIHI